MNFVSNLFSKVKDAVSPVIAVIPPGMTGDFVGILGREMYSCVGGYHLPNFVAYAGFAYWMFYLDLMKRLGIDARTLWKYMNKTNVTPFKRVPLLPYRSPDMPPRILERWGRLVWDMENIYGKERDEEGNVILPRATQRSNLKRGKMESAGGGYQGIKRVNFCVKEGHPWDQQPPVSRPTIEELRAQWIEEEEAQWEKDEIERLLEMEKEENDRKSAEI